MCDCQRAPMHMPLVVLRSSAQSHCAAFVNSKSPALLWVPDEEDTHTHTQQQQELGSVQMQDIPLSIRFPAEVHAQKLYAIDLFSLRDEKFFEIYGPQFASCDSYINDLSALAREVLKRNGDTNYMLVLYLGDTVSDPGIPALCKSAGIGMKNMWPVLLKKDRHFHGLSNERADVAFEDKEPRACWRGNVTFRAHTQAVQDSDRFKLVKAQLSSHVVDAKFCKPDPGITSAEYYGPSMSKREQLKFRYLISVEGGDVSTGLKWMLNSNSVVLMRPPTAELVLGESTLRPYVHFVPLGADFEDVEERVAWCESNLGECLKISANARGFMRENTIEVLFERSVQRVLQYCAAYRFLATAMYVASTVPFGVHCKNLFVCAEHPA